MTERQSKGKRGLKVWVGEEDYMPSDLIKLIDRDMWITCRGTDIIVYELQTKKVFFEWMTIHEVGTSRVPAGHEIRLIDTVYKLNKTPAC